MVEDFAAAIAVWQPFYNLAGSAAFTLAGLIFVAVSINIGMVALTREQGDLVQFARQTLGSFLAIMIISLVFMIPGQDRYGTGLPLLSIGVLMMWRAAKLWKKFEFESKEQRFLDNALFRSELLVPNTVCYAVLIFISVELLYGNTDYLGWMTLVIIWLLAAGSLSSWFLMLSIAKLAHGDKANG
ncbi:Uncharacterised protein [uncultured archaeon]|nr:Uncharacterised protein [uncultured archaeon]